MPGCVLWSAVLQLFRHSRCCYSRVDVCRWFLFSICRTQNLKDKNFLLHFLVQLGNVECEVSNRYKIYAIMLVTLD